MIEVQYRCAVCSSGWRVVSVPVREKGQDVVDWMNRSVIVGIGADHLKRSPFCLARSISETKIPLPAQEGGRVGEPTKH